MSQGPQGEVGRLPCLEPRRCVSYMFGGDTGQRGRKITFRALRARPLRYSEHAASPIHDGREDLP